MILVLDLKTMSSDVMAEYPALEADVSHIIDEADQRRNVGGLISPKKLLHGCGGQSALARSYLYTLAAS